GPAGDSALPSCPTRRPSDLEAGSTLTLNRLELSVAATVVWSRDGRCGLSLRAPITVDDWIAGVRTVARSGSLGQMRVDQLQSAIRSGLALPPEAPPPAASPDRQSGVEAKRV